MRRRLIAALISVSILVGCSAPPVWEKPGASHQTFLTESYECERDVRDSRLMDLNVNGSADPQRYYDRCMIAHGWELKGDGPSPRDAVLADQKQQLDTIKANNTQCVLAARSEPQSAIIVPYLAGMGGGGFTMSQLTNTAKLTPAEGRSLSFYVDKVMACERSYIDGLRPFHPQVAVIIADSVAQIHVIQAKAVRNEISIGEMNAGIQQAVSSENDKLRELFKPRPPGNP